jgi:16S rRNA (guanine966-N2)-methyltransferase
MKQSIRIIGGLYRGKKLHFPAIEGLRPTPDRVRETVFNWLMHDIRDARCLDAFAGSGALGFEAYSRGAASVTFLETNLTAYNNLIKQCTPFDSPKLQVQKIDARLFLEQSKAHFNLIFLDPPFAKNYIPDCLEILSHSTILQSGGLLYLESPDEIMMNTSLWQQIKLKKAGQVVYGLYKKLS